MANLLDEASILLTPTAYNNGSMLAVKPTNGDGDFTFSRNSAATRVNAQGLVENVQILSSNLVSNGDFSQGGTDWTLGTGWSIDQANSKVIKTGTTSSGLTQSYSFGNAKKYRLEFTILDFVSGSIKGEFSGGGGSDLFFTSNNIGNGTFTFETTTTTNRTTLQFYAFGSFQGSITNISVIEITDDTNLPRIDYTDGCGSWLLEPQSTNLYLNSETLFTQNNTTLASTYTVSFYGTGTITFSGTYNGTLIGTGLNNRVSLTFTTASGTLISTISGTCIKGQLENLTFPTSYIPTNGATSTRLQDIANNSGNASLINSEEGVLYAEIAALVDDGTQRSIAITDGTVNNIIVIRYNNYSGNSAIDGIYVNNGVLTPASILYSNSTDFTKIALSYQQGALKLYVNGTLEINVALVVNDAINWNTLQFNIGNGTQEFYGKTKALAVYKTALTDAQLTLLTTI